MQVVEVDPTKAFSAVDSLGSILLSTAGASESEIKSAERLLKLHFPEPYREFLKRYGTIRVGSTVVFGLGVPSDRPPSLLWALEALKPILPDTAGKLVPIEWLEKQQFVCLVCSDDATGSSAGPVVVCDFGREGHDAYVHPVAPDFATYLYARLAPWRHLEHGLQRLEMHVRNSHARLGYEHKSGGRLPRNYDWRPYRFCVQDVLLAATVVRHSRELNCLEVDVFLTADIPGYEPGSGAKALSVFLLSEAFKCGGTMEIRFKRNVEDGRVPAALQQVALEAGVRLVHKQRIMPDESRELFLALTEFSPALQQHIEALDCAGMLSVERACYTVHHGVWTRPELESIILGSLDPDSILGGKALPEQRHLFLEDLLHARAAVLGACLDRKLAKRDVSPEADQVVELEDTECRIEIQFEPQAYAKRYRCHEETLPVPWLADDGVQAEPIQPGDWLIALIRARDTTDLRRYFGRDLEMAERLAAAPSPNGAPHRVVVLVPHEFDEFPPQERQDWVNASRKGNIGIMVCPETTASLDADVARRLARSRILRQ